MALNFDSDSRGGTVIVFTGTAMIDRQAPSLDQIPAYVERYVTNVEAMKLTPAMFAHVYSVPLRVTPARLRGH